MEHILCLISCDGTKGGKIFHALCHIELECCLLVKNTCNAGVLHEGIDSFLFSVGFFFQEKEYNTFMAAIIFKWLHFRLLYDRRAFNPFDTVNIVWSL